MPQPGPILCATDLSPTGALAVDFAVTLAARLDRPLRLVHVASGAPDHVLGTPSSEAERVWRERLRRRVEAASARLEAERARVAESGAVVDAALLEGRPWEQVVEDAVRSEASLVVVGPHGDGASGGLAEWILGSTADRVVRHAPCPVLVGPRGEGGVALDAGPWLAAVDLSEPSLAALHLAHELAAGLGTSVRAVHVSPGENLTGDDGAAAKAYAAELGPHLAEALRKKVKAEIGRDLELEVALGDPADRIVADAAESGAAVICMGTRGRTGLAQLLLGSVAERVLQRARTPVLVTRG